MTPTAADRFAQDAVKAWAVARVSPIALVALLVALPIVGYCRGRVVERTASGYAAKKDTVRIADANVTVAKETLTVYVDRAVEAKKQSDKTDAGVVVVNDSTVTVRDPGSRPPVSVIVPTAVTADLVQLRQTVDHQAAAILRFQHVIEADSLAIVARDRLLLASKPKRRWSLGGTAGWGCNVRGCGPGGTIGLSYSLF